MEYFSLGDAIECQSALITAKKIVPSCPLNHEFYGRCLKHLCTRDGEGVITKELIPKTSQSYFPSHLELSDKIIAASFHVLSRGIKAIKFNKVPFSGKHNANQFKTRDYTFAQISLEYPIGRQTIVCFPEGYKSPFKLLHK